MNGQSLLVTLLIGLVAGWLASLIMGGGGLIRSLVTGLIGAFVGWALVYYFHINIGIDNALLAQIVVATIGSIIVIFVARIVA
ncbi:MAG: GlsB/YeaQ/YmgE family stress response membrane protein [Pseudomonadota bacterium]